MAVLDGIDSDLPEFERKAVADLRAAEARTYEVVTSGWLKLYLGDKDLVEHAHNALYLMRLATPMRRAV
jgi:hypothetical protein